MSDSRPLGSGRGRRSRWWSLAEGFDIASFMGYASSPIAHGANIILPLGGPGRGVVALELGE